LTIISSSLINTATTIILQKVFANKSDVCLEEISFFTKQKNGYSLKNTFSHKKLNLLLSSCSLKENILPIFKQIIAKLYLLTIRNLHWNMKTKRLALIENSPHFYDWIFFLRNVYFLLLWSTIFLKFQKQPFCLDFSNLYCCFVERGFYKT